MNRRKLFEGQPGWSDAIDSTSRSTAHRAKKRGWIFVNYHDQEVCRGEIDMELAINVAKVIAYQFRYDVFPGYITHDDIKQEVLLRLWRIAGKIKQHDFQNYFRIGIYAAKNLKVRQIKGETTPLAGGRPVK